VESPDTESKEGAAQRAAGVALRGARETPGHTHARARRTGVGPTSVPAPLGLYPVSSLVSAPPSTTWCAGGISARSSV